jgi:hypothetical protein
MAAPIRCIEAILYDVYLSHFWLLSLFKVIRAFSTTFVPREWAMILILTFGYLFLKSEINFAIFGPFLFAIDLAIPHPEGFTAVFESQLNPIIGIFNPFAYNDSLVLSTCSLAEVCSVHTPWIYITNSFLYG